MYKLGIHAHNNILKQALQEGKNPPMLVAKSSQFVFHEIQEFIGFLEEIETPGEREMSRITIRFANNQVTSTMAYIDKDTIKKGEIISLIGMYINEGGGARLYCKGGLNKIWSKPRDIGYMKFDSVYRMGIIPSLSDLRLSRRFADYDLSSEPQQIGSTGFYVLYDTQIKSSTTSQNTTGVKTDTTFVGIDMSKIIGIEEETEDIPDIEIEDEEQNSKNTIADNRFIDENGNFKQVSL